MGKKKGGSKRSEVETTNAENGKKDVKENQFEDTNECTESLKYGTKYKAVDSEVNHQKNKPDSVIKKKSSLNQQSKGILDDMNKAQNEKMGCGIPGSILKINEKVHEDSKESSCSNRKKGNKNKSSSDQQNKDNFWDCDTPGNQQSTGSLDHKNMAQNEKMDCGIPGSTPEINEKVHEDSNESFSLNRKKRNKNKSSSEQQNKDCLWDVKKTHKTNEKPHEKAYNSLNSNKKKNTNNDHEPDEQSNNGFVNNRKNRHNCNKSEATLSTDRYSVKPRRGDSNQYNNKNLHREQNIRNISQRSQRISSDYESDYTFNETNKRNKNDFHVDRICRSLIEDGECFLEEIDADLFQLPCEISLAHCVARDLRMGAGIAVDFKHYFGGVGKLVDQKLEIGDVGVITRHNQNVFYLITKSSSRGKPTMDTMKKALDSLLAKMIELNLMKLGIPKIGCGLDGLDWDEVKSLIMSIFSGTGIHITVCIPSKILDRKAPWPMSVYVTPRNLWEMESDTNIIIFIDLKQVYKPNWTNDVVDKVNSRYPFKNDLLKNIANKKLNPGDTTHYTVHNETITCVFFEQNVYYSSLEDAFRKVCSLNTLYKYIAIQSGLIESGNNFQHIAWIVLILRSFTNNCELWLCGNDVEITNYDQYCRSKCYSSNYSTNHNSLNQINYKHGNDSYTTNQRSNQNGGRYSQIVNKIGFEKYMSLEK